MLVCHSSSSTTMAGHSHKCVTNATNCLCICCDHEKAGAKPCAALPTNKNNFRPQKLHHDIDQITSGFPPTKTNAIRNNGSGWRRYYCHDHYHSSVFQLRRYLFCFLTVGTFAVVLQPILQSFFSLSFHNLSYRWRSAPKDPPGTRVM